MSSRILNWRYWKNKDTEIQMMMVEYNNFIKVVRGYQENLNQITEEEEVILEYELTNVALEVLNEKKGNSEVLNKLNKVMSRKMDELTEQDEDLGHLDVLDFKQIKNTRREQAFQASVQELLDENPDALQNIRKAMKIDKVSKSLYKDQVIDTAISGIDLFKELNSIENTCAVEKNQINNAKKALKEQVDTFDSLHITEESIAEYEMKLVEMQTKEALAKDALTRAKELLNQNSYLGGSA